MDTKNKPLMYRKNCQSWINHPTHLATPSKSPLPRTKARNPSAPTSSSLTTSSRLAILSSISRQLPLPREFPVPAKPILRLDVFVVPLGLVHHAHVTLTMLPKHRLTESSLCTGGSSSIPTPNSACTARLYPLLEFGRVVLPVVHLSGFRELSFSDRVIAFGSCKVLPLLWHFKVDRVPLTASSS